MDVVYLCRSGHNEELRYSLRSLSNLPHDKVWLFGGRPTWCTAELVETDQHGAKFNVTRNSIRQACLHPDVSGTFALFNDDFFAVRPTKPAQLHRGPMREVLDWYLEHHAGGRYCRSMQATYDFLLDKGITEPLSYELHMPLIVNKADMLEALDLCQDVFAVQWRSVYGNLFSVGGQQEKDCKVYAPELNLPSGPWLSSSDETFPYCEPILRWIFPNPSEWETEETQPAPKMRCGTRRYGTDERGRRILLST